MEPELLPGEEIRPIEGYEGLYSVTSEGRVWNHRRDCWHHCPLDKDGYRHITLSKRGGVILFTKVSTLVLTAFIGPRPEKHYCLHNNDDKTDDSLRNLRWGTPQENYQDQIDNDIKKGRRKVTPEIVLEIRRLYAEGNMFQEDLAALFGIAQPTISSIVARRSWRSI